MKTTNVTMDVQFCISLASTAAMVRRRISYAEIKCKNERENDGEQNLSTGEFAMGTRWSMT